MRARAGPGRPAIHDARNRRFVARWSEGADLLTLRREFLLADRKAVLQLAQRLRKAGYPLSKRPTLARVHVQDPLRRGTAALREAARVLTLADVAPAILYDGQGRRIGTLDPKTRRRTLT